MLACVAVAVPSTVDVEEESPCAPSTHQCRLPWHVSHSSPVVFLSGLTTSARQNIALLSLLLHFLCLSLRGLASSLEAVSAGPDKKPSVVQTVDLVRPAVLQTGTRTPGQDWCSVRSHVTVNWPPLHLLDGAIEANRIRCFLVGDSVSAITNANSPQKR